MKRKTIVTAALLVFVAASIAFLAFKELKPGTSRVVSDAVAMEKKAPATGESANSRQRGRQVVAYYFHTTFRCATCYRIEQLTNDAIQTGFPKELKNGRLVWKIVNVEEQGNGHFIKDYQLFTKSVVLVDMKDGKQVRWKNLKEVWEFVDREDAFRKYIQRETSAYLGEG